MAHCILLIIEGIFQGPAYSTVGNSGLSLPPFYRADGSSLSAAFNTPAFGYILVR
jgi:hypothetical protein